MKNQLTEAVVFCFVKKDKILLEDRGKGFNNEAFYPNGNVDKEDKDLKGNYLENALYREVKEEFDNKIIIEKKKYLGNVRVDEIKVNFHIYLISKWSGNFPEVIKEPGEPDSKIAFFKMTDATKMFKYDSAFEILKLIKKNII